MAPRKYDWTILKREYVTGAENKSDFAGARGIDRKQVVRRALKEGWDAARDVYKNERTAKEAKAIQQEQVKRTVRAFRTSRAIRKEVHAFAQHVTIRTQNKYAPDPVTKAIPPFPSAKEIAADLDIVERGFKLQMVTGQHPLEPDRMEITGADGEAIELEIIDPKEALLAKLKAMRGATANAKQQRKPDRR